LKTSEKPTVEAHKLPDHDTARTGSELRRQKFENKRTEAQIASRALNRMIVNGRAIFDCWLDELMGKGELRPEFDPRNEDL